MSNALFSQRSEEKSGSAQRRIFVGRGGSWDVRTLQRVSG
jgi:hypothetical protein